MLREVDRPGGVLTPRRATWSPPECNWVRGAESDTENSISSDPSGRYCKRVPAADTEWTSLTGSPTETSRGRVPDLHVCDARVFVSCVTRRKTYLKPQVRSLQFGNVRRSGVFLEQSARNSIAPKLLHARTRAELARILRRYYEAGATVSELSDFVGPNTTHVRNLLREAGTTMRPCASRLCIQCGSSPAWPRANWICRDCRKVTR